MPVSYLLSQQYYSIVVPVFNEEGNIKTLKYKELKRAFAYLDYGR